MHFTHFANALRRHIMECSQVDPRFRNYTTSTMSFCGLGGLPVPMMPVPPPPVAPMGPMGLPVPQGVIGSGAIGPPGLGVIGPGPWGQTSAPIGFGGMGPMGGVGGA